MAIVDRDALRRRLGRVGVWGALALRPAEEERRPAAEVERLGYGALWFGEGPTTKEAFTHAAILLEATAYRRGHSFLEMDSATMTSQTAAAIAWSTHSSRGVT